VVPDGMGGYERGNFAELPGVFSSHPLVFFPSRPGECVRTPLCLSAHVTVTSDWHTDTSDNVLSSFPWYSDLAAPVTNPFYLALGTSMRAFGRLVVNGLVHRQATSRELFANDLLQPTWTLKDRPFAERPLCNITFETRQCSEHPQLHLTARLIANIAQLKYGLAVTGPTFRAQVDFVCLGDMTFVEQVPRIFHSRLYARARACVCVCVCVCACVCMCV
jgi:hypothetical protein